MLSREKTIGIVFCCIACFICLSCASVQNRELKDVVASCKGQTQKDLVICRGLTWLFEHPVTLQGDGFLELGEELNLFYRLYLRADNEKEKKFFKDYTISRIDYLLNEHDLQVDYAGEITAYLNFAKIMKRMDIHRFQFIKGRYHCPVY